ncbi:hypothetical protein [Vallitalea okinawensis]|uniref:hypothetical protein n=1 Tax=Vallitalea okinawensis TaxID=2078660 RepID=UPI000CFCC057|nr:hypothetical protein [Vallitalea okinawensis]
MKKIYILLGGIIILLFGILFYRNYNMPSKDEINQQEENTDSQQVDSGDEQIYRTIEIQRTSDLIIEETDELIKLYYNDDFDFYILNKSEEIKNLDKSVNYEPNQGIDITVKDSWVKITGDYKNASTNWVLTIEEVNYGGQIYEELEIQFIKTARLMSYVYLLEDDATVPAGQFYYLNDEPKDFLFKFVPESDENREIPFLPEIDKTSVEEAISTELFNSQCDFMFEWQDDYILKVKCYDWQYTDAQNSEKFFGDMTLGKDGFGEDIRLSYFACRIGKQMQVYAMDMYDLGVTQLDIVYEEERLWDMPKMRNEHIISFTIANGAQGYHYERENLYYSLEDMDTITVEDGEIISHMTVEDYPFADLYNQDIFFIPETIGSYESSYHKGGCIYNSKGEILVRDAQLEGFKKLKKDNLMAFYRTGTEMDYDKIQLVVYDAATHQVYQHQTSLTYVPGGIGVSPPVVSESNQSDWLYISNTFTATENYNFAPIGYMFDYKTGEVAEMKGNPKGDQAILEDGILIYLESYGDKNYQVLDLIEDKDLTKAVGVKNSGDPIIISDGYISWYADGKIQIYDLAMQIKREITVDGYPRLLGIANGKLYFSK